MQRRCDTVRYEGNAARSAKRTVTEPDSVRRKRKAMTHNMHKNHAPHTKKR